MGFILPSTWTAEHVRPCGRPPSSSCSLLSPSEGHGSEGGRREGGQVLRPNYTCSSFVLSWLELPVGGGRRLRVGEKKEEEKEGRKEGRKEGAKGKSWGIDRTNNEVWGGKGEAEKVGTANNGRREERGDEGMWNSTYRIQGLNLPRWISGVIDFTNQHSITIHPSEEDPSIRNYQCDAERLE